MRSPGFTIKTYTEDEDLRSSRTFCRGRSCTPDSTGGHRHLVAPLVFGLDRHRLRV